MSRELDKIRKNTTQKLETAKQSTQDLMIVENHLGQVSNEYKRVAEISHNAPEVIDNIEMQIKEKIKLNGWEISLCVFATALQCARQLVLTRFPERVDDKTSAKNTKGHVEEHSNRHHRLYNPSLNEIISNPVPFDANIGANGKLRGGGKLGHRVKAIGHDPVLGLIFGTANIATSTITISPTFQSYHIRTNLNGVDSFAHTARTDLVLSKTFEKITSSSLYDKQIVAASLLKEIIHLQSDLNTKNSLPIPLVSAISPQAASDLAKYGFDMANLVTVGKQASFALMINFIISVIHGFFYKGQTDFEKQCYEAKTRKIISYSTAAASTINIGVTIGTQNWKNLDIGGILVALHRFITDSIFIDKLKTDFIKNELTNTILGKPYNFMEGLTK